ncbi:FAD-dependent monooxygenase [Chloroflexi bacterium TSY]|nr:FAD-dependent monooxygenase [Chloroflexi bacterium TSY]
MKIIIVGGGIGGLTTAVALQQHGYDAHVYEAAPAIKPIGKGIWVPTNAMLVLDRLNLGNEIAAKGIALERIELCDMRDGLLQAIDLTAVYKRFGRTTTSILRADLQETLVAALQDRTLHLGKRCIDLQDDNKSATVIFEDGTSVTGDVVVGADGIRSRVREAVVPNVALRYSGQNCYLGVANFSLSSTSTGTVREIWGGKVRFGYSAVSGDKIYWFAPVKSSADSAMPIDPLETLCHLYNDFPSSVLDIINHTSGEEIIRPALYDFDPIERWHKGRIVLMGDAAHAMTPNLGQGGAQAIEDAYVLAHLLQAGDSLESAFAQYQTIRQPKARKIVTTAWRLGQIAHMANPWLRRLRNLAFQWTPAYLKQRQVEALYSLNF